MGSELTAFVFLSRRRRAGLPSSTITNIQSETCVIECKIRVPHSIYYCGLQPGPKKKVLGLQITGMPCCFAEQRSHVSQPGSRPDAPSLDSTPCRCCGVNLLTSRLREQQRKKRHRTIRRVRCGHSKTQDSRENDASCASLLLLTKNGQPSPCSAFDASVEGYCNDSR